MRDRLFRRAFRRAFFAAAIVLCLLDGAVLQRLQTPPDVDAPPARTVSAEPLTVLIARQAGEPQILLLLRLDPRAERLVVSLLPARLETAGGAALGEIWEERGGAAACAALEETLGVSVERYLSLPDEAAASMLDTLGSIDLFLPEGESGRRILGEAQPPPRAGRRDGAGRFGAATAAAGAPRDRNTLSNGGKRGKKRSHRRRF